MDRMYWKFGELAKMNDAVANYKLKYGPNVQINWNVVKNESNVRVTSGKLFMYYVYWFPRHWNVYFFS